MKAILTTSMRIKIFHDAHHIFARGASLNSPDARQKGARHGVAHPGANSRASQGMGVALHRSKLMGSKADFCGVVG